MINAEPVQRRAFLASCRRHIGPGGVVVIQQAAPGWFKTAGPSEAEVDGIRRVTRSAHREGLRIDVMVEYHVGDRMWTHAFSRYEIGEDELAADLASAGLQFDRWLTDDHSWFAARPFSTTKPAS